MPTFSRALPGQEPATIHYEDTGTGDPVVLWSHGFLMDHTMFDPQVEALDGVRHVRWDERGFGATDAPGDFTYWDSADDAVALLDHLGVERAVLAGMSQGGFLSLRAALAHPDRVAGLVLIDTQAGPEDPETLESYQGMLDAMAYGDDATRRGVAEIVASLILADDELAPAWIERWLGREPESILAPGRCLLGRDDVTDRLGEIACPALVVHGTADAAIGIDKAERLRSDLPDCRDLVPVEGAGHAANLTHPDAVNPHIRAFLDAL